MMSIIAYVSIITLASLTDEERQSVCDLGPDGSNSIQDLPENLDSVVMCAKTLRSDADSLLVDRSHFRDRIDVPVHSRQVAAQVFVWGTEVPWEAAEIVTWNVESMSNHRWVARGIDAEGEVVRRWHSKDAVRCPMPRASEVDEVGRVLWRGNVQISLHKYNKAICGHLCVGSHL
jgi:hypothetical protein